MRVGCFRLGGAQDEGADDQELAVGSVEHPLVDLLPVPANPERARVSSVLPSAHVTPETRNPKPLVDVRPLPCAGSRDRG